MIQLIHVEYDLAHHFLHILHTLAGSKNKKRTWWRDNNNGSFSKLIVVNKILPALNEKLGCKKTFPQYQSRLKWFKIRYNEYLKLLRHNSGFGWDFRTKKFTASDEVWDGYIKSNGNSSYRTNTIADYEDLQIAIGNGTATGRHAIAIATKKRRRTNYEAKSKSSDIIPNLDNLPQGKFFLMDCGFPNRRQFLAPFRGVRYHLQDFAGQGRNPENAKELFNLRHASLRNVIERIFGIFKSRFTVFKTAPPFPYKTQAELVLACAGLHNFLRNECRSDEFPVEFEDEESSDEEDNVELFFESQEQQRENANQWRTTISTQMWSDI
ncbi:hypothetical protein OROGR_031085 [Orobanche gracilis]